MSLWRQRNDVARTSMRRHYVASTSLRCYLPDGYNPRLPYFQLKTQWIPISWSTAQNIDHTIAARENRTLDSLREGENLVLQAGHSASLNTKKRRVEETWCLVRIMNNSISLLTESDDYSRRFPVPHA